MLDYCQTRYQDFTTFSLERATPRGLHIRRNAVVFDWCRVCSRIHVRLLIWLVLIVFIFLHLPYTNSRTGLCCVSLRTSTHEQLQLPLTLLWPMPPIVVFLFLIR